MMGKLKKLTGYRLFLPLSCLIIVLLINLITTPTFFRITINNGVLYGYIIDVINRASELVVLAVGMTLVVSASAGTDISVGAVMAGGGFLDNPLSFLHLPAPQTRQKILFHPFLEKKNKQINTLI